MFMLALFALTLADTGAPAEDPGLIAGREALADKQADSAIGPLVACLGRDQSNEDCRWELGWAYWLKSDWKQVVSVWEQVPSSRKDRDRYLAQAKDNLGVESMLAKSASTAPESFSSEAAEGTTLRLRAVGDMMIGTDFPRGYLPPDGGAESFAKVSHWLTDADLSFGNLEGPLCDGGRTTKCRPNAKPGSCYAFRTPASYAVHFKAAGFDMVSTANNHASDFGDECRRQTETVLDEQGIAHSGRPGDIASLEANGLKVAMIAFGTSRSSHYINDHKTAAKLVTALSATHDIVLVSFHGGAEGSSRTHVPDKMEIFYGEKRGHLRKFARVVIDAGADMVIGHGPHVLRAMEVYKGRLVAYSLGNFATYGRFNIRGVSGLGVVLEATMDAQGRFVSGKLLPTKLIGRGIPVPDDAMGAVNAIRVLSDADFPKTGIQVAQDGSIAPR
jgi:poly-gamma-glutamate capsule biosynthesis protein CapA/YwtB (metallophosphatase superfamily)